MRRLAVALVAAMLLAAPARRSEPPIPWAWERREDLRFLGPHHTVAFYAGLITLDGDRVDVAPRRNPLLLAEKTHRIAVVRIETKHPRLDAAQRKATIAEIAHLFRNAEELQIDFDATRSERAFYRALLLDLRQHIDAPLTITALASWCMDDRWMDGLPIDDAIPMLFRMGRQPARVEQLTDERCRASVGISLDEPIDVPRGKRVWVFNPTRWTEEAWSEAKRAASR